MKAFTQNRLPQFLCILLVSMMWSGRALAQEQSHRDPIWLFGLNAGLNINFVGAGYQNLEPPGTVGNFVPKELTDGTAPGLYAGIMAEYNSHDWWGAQLRLNYDVRSADITDNTQAVEKQFDVSFSYLTIEPLLKINPGITPGLHFVAGPLVAINIAGEFDFRPDKDADPTVEGVEVPDVNSVAFGISGGVGYDIYLNDDTEDPRWRLSPFLEGSWMFHQRGTSFPDLDQDAFDDIWTTVSLRAGVHFMFGSPPPPDVVEFDPNNPAINLALITPLGGIIRSRKVEEYFPLVPHVFFDSSSTDIPSRYVQLDQDDAAEFTENDLLDPEDIGNLDARERSVQQLAVYYQILNVYGARMRDNPGTRVQLIGSGGKTDDGQTLAENVKSYLVNQYGIDEGRISIRAQKLPRRPSGSSRTPKEDRSLVDEENRRVEFVTSDPALQRPVRIRRVQDSPIDNDLVLDIDENTEVRSWQVAIEGEGRSFTFGPYYRNNQRIDPVQIMSGIEKGNYTAEVAVTTEDGEVIRHKQDFELVAKADDSDETRGERYSITFEYGQTDAVKSYEKFLRSDVAPRIDPGERVIIHGHTDNVGNEKVNYRLSLKRAREVRDILRNEMTKNGRKSKIDATGLGEDQTRYSFDNSLPEGRFYNRTVIIEIFNEN